MLHADQINFNPQETQVTKCCEVQWLTPADIQNTAMQQLTWTKSHQHRKRNLIFYIFIQQDLIDKFKEDKSMNYE